MNLKLLALGAALIGATSFMAAPNAKADWHGDQGGYDGGGWHGDHGGWQGNRGDDGDRHDGDWHDRDRHWSAGYGGYYTPPAYYAPPPAYYYGAPVISFGFSD